MTDSALGGDREARDRLIGIALTCAAVTIFTSLDSSAKFAGAHGVPTLQIVWVRYAVSVVFAALALRPWATPALFRTRRPGAHVVRALFLLGSTTFNFIAVQHLQLAQTISISFAAPLIVTAAAGPLLGEWAGPRRWAAVIVGFLGVLIVVQPEPGAFQPWALFSVATAFCNAGYAIWNRLMISTESPGSMLIYGSLLSTIALAPGVPFVWVSPSSGWVIFALLLMGVAGGISHWLLILANRRAPATLLAPFSYVQLLSMIASGYLIFGDVPGPYTLLGAAIIVASGLYVLYRERVRREG
ncbi:MAG TPA: DMT family transporter [Bauldia sp.]|nr:DMT family transporter [Bauldia sp.]